jgi:hypothetical protein
MIVQNFFQIPPKSNFKKKGIGANVEAIWKKLLMEF